MARLKYYNSSTQTWEYADNVAANAATNAVLFVEQTINDQQKEQARKNIDAASLEDVGDKSQLQTENKNDLVSAINELYNREDQIGENPLPEYTEEDYGKVLSPTEDGLTWKELEINSEEGTEVFIQPEEPSDAVIGDFWWDTDEESSGGDSGSVSLPENVVTCNLEGVTEDESTVPVNADTLGGFAASEYYRMNTLLAEDITSQIVLDAIVNDMYMSCFRLGNLVVLTVAFNLNSSPDAWAITPIATGLPPNIATNCGALVSDAVSYSSVVEVKPTGELIIRNGSTSVGTNFWRGQLIYVCNTEVTT